VTEERYEEGDEVWVTDFDGVEHEAVLKRTVGLMHQECDEADAGKPCPHRFWAAEWEVPAPGADGGVARRVWPIGKDWDRVRPKKRKPLDVEQEEEAERKKTEKVKKPPLRISLRVGSEQRDVMWVGADGAIGYGKPLTNEERSRLLGAARENPLGAEAVFFVLIASELARLSGGR